MGPQGRIMAAKPFDLELLEYYSCKCCLFANNKNPSWAFLCGMGQENQLNQCSPQSIFVVGETYSISPCFKDLIPLKNYDQHQSDNSKTKAMADVFVSSSNTPFWPPYWIEASQTYFKHLICFVTHELESILYLLPAILVLVIRILNWGKWVVMGHSVQSFSAHIFKFWFDLFAVHLHHSQITHFLALFKNSFYLFFHSL